MKISKDDLARLRSEVRTTGFASIDNALNAGLFESLQQEASAQRAHARRVTDDGDISYKGYMADLGEVARRVLSTPPLTEFLRSLFDKPCVLAESSSCYTYYEAGDFLSTHRDNANDCEVTFLIYLDASAPDPDSPNTGLVLQIFDDDAGKPGSLRQVIKTHSGRVVVGYGSRQWHSRPPLLKGEKVAVLTTCFSCPG